MPQLEKSGCLRVELIQNRLLLELQSKSFKVASLLILYKASNIILSILDRGLP